MKHTLIVWGLTILIHSNVEMNNAVDAIVDLLLFSHFTSSFKRCVPTTTESASQLSVLMRTFSVIN